MGTDQTLTGTICSASVSGGRLRVVLSDGRDLSTPIGWYPLLAKASASQLEKIEISPFGLHWPELDEDVGLNGMFAGRQSASKPSPPVIAPIVDLAIVREQKRMFLLADAAIDYPEQKDIISEFANG